MRLYSLSAVENYIRTLENVDITCLEGCLLDTFFINHGNAIEWLEVVPLNEWSSAYKRHVYKKRVPKKCIKGLLAELDECLEENEKEFSLWMDERIDDIRNLLWEISEFNGEEMDDIPF